MVLGQELSPNAGILLVKQKEAAPALASSSARYQNYGSHVHLGFVEAILKFNSVEGALPKLIRSNQLDNNEPLEFECLKARMLLWNVMPR